MNFKQVLSPGSTCAMLHSPQLHPRGGSPYLLSLFLLSFLLLLWHAKALKSCHIHLTVFFSPHCCVLLLFFSFIWPILPSLSLYFNYPSEKIVLREALFFIFSLYPALPPILPLTSGCQSLSCSPDNAFCFSYPLWSLPFLFCPPLPLSSPVLFFSSSSFRRVIGALYLTR